MSKKSPYTTKDRLEQIVESIELIISRCENINDANEFLLSPDNMMRFDSCVMRLQAIGEQIGKLLKEDNCPFDKFPEIPWVAAYDMRNFISHEYANIDEAIVFDVIKEDLPRMQEAVKKILNDY
ncbi:MAG: DUF86 domain-containing protein [Bacteroidaceae bacterium]|nr:DUF86 domain-containing protein [Bacteroides sp.]MBQ8241939.1 DUF86 domain-containing protein [Bacteroidaceae bacterium]